MSKELFEAFARYEAKIRLSSKSSFNISNPLYEESVTIKHVGEKLKPGARVMYFDSLDKCLAAKEAAKRGNLDEAMKSAIWTSLNENKNEMICSIGINSHNKKALQLAMDLIYEDYLRELTKKDFCDEVASVILTAKQSDAASVKRNKHYHEAVRIMRQTWDKYPCASKNAMCKSVCEYFDNGISIATLERAVKDENLLPMKPKKYTTFQLVI